MKTKLIQTRISVLSLSCILCVSWFAPTVAVAQRMMTAQFNPSLAYVYPAGAQRGVTTSIIVGGQYLEDTDQIYISGSGGVHAKVTGFDRPLNMREVQQMRNKMDEARKDMGMDGGERPRMREMQQVLEKAGITREQLQKMKEHATMRRDPKVQENAPVAEQVFVEIEVDPDAKPGRREIRVLRDGRISDPIAFYIGGYPERTEDDRAAVERTLPVVFNGQIMPGETDGWKFAASKGDQMVVASAARELIPHLADAVPGWFQAVVALYDSDGNELAYADDYRFNPDPILYYEIPADGIYTLEIRDSIHRGREDFIYRITLGEIPFITSIFPLGGNIREETVVKLEGKNLPDTEITLEDETRIEHLQGTPLAYPVPFAQSSLPEIMEAEPNNTAADAPLLKVGCVVNGKISAPGDRDVIAVQLEKGVDILAEVTARRLNSPLDSVLMITDETGKQLAFNNDYEDKKEGRITHHADARIIFEAPRAGIYHVHLGDIQNGGGTDFSYRLLLDTPKPDFALRAAPSNLNGAPGESVPLTVYALRKDGFDGEIELRLKNNLEGLRLDGARIPSGQDKVELTVTLPDKDLYVPEPLAIEGRAKVKTKTVRRVAVPAEDMMQAFIYHHLIPTEELLLANIETRRARPQAPSSQKRAVRLKPGRKTRISFQTSPWFESVMTDYEVDPRNVPAGVTIEEVTVERGVIEITLNADNSVEKGLEGNLLFNQFIHRQRIGRNQDGEREPIRIAAGTLPAVPFIIK